LITAKSEYAKIISSKIITKFIPDDDEGHLWNKFGEPNEEMTEKLAMLHDLVRKLVEVIPMMSVTFKSNLLPNFPYIKQSSFKIAGFIYNLLKIPDYCPNMMHDIYEIVFEKVLEIDTSITRAEIEDSEEIDDDDEEEEEEFDEKIKSNQTDSDVMKLPLAETLDVAMNMLFKYFHSKLNVDSTFSASNQKLIESAMFQYFDEHILKTQNSKHLHFLFFYISSFRVSTNLF
jgi:hypothetical protein